MAAKFFLRTMSDRSKLLMRAAQGSPLSPRGSRRRTRPGSVPSDATDVVNGWAWNRSTARRRPSRPPWWRTLRRSSNGTNGHSGESIHDHGGPSVVGYRWYSRTAALATPRYRTASVGVGGGRLVRNQTRPANGSGGSSRPWIVVTRFWRRRSRSGRLL